MTYAPRFLPAAAVVGLLGGLVIGKFLLRRGSTEPSIDVPNDPRL
jgi:hypothetical protein